MPGGGAKIAPKIFLLRLTKKISPITYNETLCKFLFHTCGNYNALIWLKKIFSGLIRPLKSVGWPKIFFGGYWHFLGGMHKSKVAQNPKICRKPVEFFDLSILCALKVHF